MFCQFVSDEFLLPAAQFYETYVNLVGITDHSRTIVIGFLFHAYRFLHFFRDKFLTGLLNLAPPITDIETILPLLQKSFAASLPHFTESHFKVLAAVIAREPSIMQAAIVRQFLASLLDIWSCHPDFIAIPFIADGQLAARLRSYSEAASRAFLADIVPLITRPTPSHAVPSILGDVIWFAGLKTQLSLLDCRLLFHLAQGFARLPPCVDPSKMPLDDTALPLAWATISVEVSLRYDIPPIEKPLQDDPALARQWEILKQRADREGVDRIALVPGLDGGEQTPLTAFALRAMRRDLDNAGRFRDRIRVRMTPARILQEECGEVQGFIRAVCVRDARAHRVALAELGRRVLEFLCQVVRLRVVDACAAFGHRCDPTKMINEFRREVTGSGIAEFLRSPDKAAGEIGRLVTRIVFAETKVADLHPQPWVDEFNLIFRLLRFYYYGHAVVLADAIAVPIKTGEPRPRPEIETREGIRDVLRSPIAMLAVNLEYIGKKLDAGEFGAVTVALATFRRLFEGMCNGCRGDPSQASYSAVDVALAMSLLVDPSGWEGADLLERVCRQLEAVWREVPEFARCVELTEPRGQVSEWLSAVFNQ
jgi:hypothetical protein